MKEKYSVNVKTMEQQMEFIYWILNALVIVKLVMKESFAKYSAVKIVQMVEKKLGYLLKNVSVNVRNIPQGSSAR